MNQLVTLVNKASTKCHLQNCSSPTLANRMCVACKWYIIVYFIIAGAAVVIEPLTSFDEGSTVSVTQF